jgi:hypothetical protein
VAHAALDQDRAWWVREGVGFLGCHRATSARRCRLDGLSQIQRYGVRLKLHRNRTFERRLVPNDPAAHFNQGRRQRSICGSLYENTQFKVFGGSGGLGRPEQDA